MLFEGQGNAGERPEYQIMVIRKRSQMHFFLFGFFFGNPESLNPIIYDRAIGHVFV